MESVGDDANSVFHEDQKFFKSDTFESDKNCLIFIQNTIGIIPNTFHDFKKKFKSDTFENYKTFVPVEVQSHRELENN